MENAFVLISPHVDREKIASYIKEKGLGDLEIWSEPTIPSFINPLESIVILLLSGGTEIMVKKIVEKAFSMVYINCVPLNSTMSSAAELKGYYRNNHEIKVSSFSEETFKLLFNIERIKGEINKSRLLLVGRPQEWILTSENLSAPSPFQAKLVPVNTREFRSMLSKINQEQAHEEAEFWDERGDIGKISRSEFFNAGLIYVTFKKMLDKYRANMLGIRCSELQEYGIAGCLAMNRLTEEGIVSSCEGDIEAAFSLKIIMLLTERLGWMTNISSIDFNERKLYLTHCTMPVDMHSINEGELLGSDTDYNFFEEFMNVKQKKPVTIFRLGKDMNYSVLEGEVQTDILGKLNYLRSTMEIKTDSSLQDWFETICGNHQIVVYGNHTEQLKYFFEII